MPQLTNISLAKKKVDAGQEIEDDKRITIEYPTNFTQNNKHKTYLVFNCLEVMGSTNIDHRAIRQGLLSQKGKTKSKLMIALPMPDQLMDNTRHDYGQPQTNMFADIAVSAMKGYADGGVGGALSGAAEMGLVRGIEKLSTSNAVTQVTGQVTLSNHTTQFKGTQMREVTFRYTLQPRNLDELKKLGNMVHQLKKMSSPSLTKSKVQNFAEGKLGRTLNASMSTTFTAPPLWSVEERLIGVGHRSFDRFIMFPCVVTAVDCNFTPNGQHQTIAETLGDPHAVELAITLKETIATTAEDIAAYRHNTSAMIENNWRDDIQN